jgi:hypothetical protein
VRNHPIEEWLDWISPKAGNAPPLVVRPELLAALQEFCRLSKSLTEDLPTSIAATSATPIYRLPGLEGLLPVELVLCRFNGTRLIPKGKEELDGIMCDWDVSSSQMPTHYFQPSMGEVRIVKQLASGYSGTITGRCAWMPSLESEAVPIVLWEQWRDGITDGVLSRVFDEAGKPWYQPAVAEQKRKRFLEAIGLAAKNMLQGNVRKPQAGYVRSVYA